MRYIPLATTGRITSHLGFGCSGLMGASSRRHSLHLLETAYNAGIRHFDVAPMYGYGEAEQCLGDFLIDHATDTTVTTKFGLTIGRNQPLLRVARRWAGATLEFFPAIKRRLAPASSALGGGMAKLRFDVTTARLSLENSLRKLRRTYLDVFLLHEAEALDLNDDALLRFLEDSQASGKIGTFGIGGEAKNVSALVSHRPAYLPILQFEWSIFDSDLPSHPGSRIYHRPISANLQKLHSALSANETVCNDWSARVGADLRHKEALAALMLKASLSHHPTSQVLFSSRSPAKIIANAATEANASLTLPALRLLELVQHRTANLNLQGAASNIKTGK